MVCQTCSTWYLYRKNKYPTRKYKCKYQLLQSTCGLHVCHVVRKLARSQRLSSFAFRQSALSFWFQVVGAGCKDEAGTAREDHSIDGANSTRSNRFTSGRTCSWTGHPVVFHSCYKYYQHITSDCSYHYYYGHYYHADVRRIQLGLQTLPLCCSHYGHQHLLTDRRVRTLLVFNLLRTTTTTTTTTTTHTTTTVVRPFVRVHPSEPVPQE